MINLAYISSVDQLHVALLYVSVHCSCGTYVRKGRSTLSRTPTRCWLWHSMTPAIRSCPAALTMTSRYAEHEHPDTNKWKWMKPVLENHFNIHSYIFTIADICIFVDVFYSNTCLGNVQICTFSKYLYGHTRAVWWFLHWYYSVLSNYRVI